MRESARSLVVAFVSTAILGAAHGVIACGGAPADAKDATIVREGPVAFKLPLPPPTWKRIKVTHASLSFRDDVHDASVLINGRCAALDGDTPLVALTNHLVMGTTEREIDSQNVEPFDGREALHTRLHAKLDGVPFAFDIFVLKKDGCVYDFVYIAAREAIDSGAPEFGSFVRGFHTLAGSGAS
jgi:hypothetical protein